MELDRIVSQLRSEMDRIGRAIALLEEGATARIAKLAGLDGRARKGKRGMTAAGRKRISDAMKRRWADRRKTSGAAAKATPAAKKRRGGITPEGRKRLAEAMRKRWAERKKKPS